MSKNLTFPVFNAFSCKNIVRVNHRVVKLHRKVDRQSDHRHDFIDDGKERGQDPAVDWIFRP